MAQNIPDNMNATFKHQCRALVFVVSCIFATQLWASGSFNITGAQTSKKGDVYYLNADITYHLSEKQIQALESGLALTIELLILIEENYWRYFYDDIADLRQAYQLSHHPLTNQYLLNVINTGEERAFSTLEEALSHLGKVRAVPILDSSLIENSGRHRVSLKAQVDLASLPLTLRPIAYFSQSWGTESDWFSWPLMQ